MLVMRTFTSVPVPGAGGRDRRLFVGFCVTHGAHNPSPAIAVRFQPPAPAAMNYSFGVPCFLEVVEAGVPPAVDWGPGDDLTWFPGDAPGVAWGLQRPVAFLEAVVALATLWENTCQAEDTQLRVVQVWLPVLMDLAHASCGGNARH